MNDKRSFRVELSSVKVNQAFRNHKELSFVRGTVGQISARPHTLTAGTIREHNEHLARRSLKTKGYKS